MAEKISIQLRISPGEAKGGCTKNIKVGGMRLSVRVPAGVSNGRVLQLRGVPFPRGPQDVLVKIQVSRNRAWLWVCLAFVAAGCLGQVMKALDRADSTTEQSPSITAASNGDRSLAAAMQRLYQAQAQQDTAAARVEAELLRRGSWEATGGSGSRGTAVTVTAPDMAAMMEDIEGKLEQGQLSASSPEAVCEEVLRRLQQGEYTLKKTHVMVTYTGQGEEAALVQTEALADAVYGGLLSWQEAALEQWKEKNP